jgi:surface antigen
VPATSSNRYAYGNCTWYVANRRAQFGQPIPNGWGNAATWAWYASVGEYAVNHTPSVGAIMQNGGGYGHVAFVENINPDGSILVSEMNNYACGGFAQTNYRTVSNPSDYNFIH